MLTGKKLLLADDSAAVQKVIDLTFSDEGMNVTAVGDGQRAWEELEHFPPPDVIIADVFMPGIGGYELCRLVKQNERFAQIPVMLLVSSFEPFDEGEARRAGADDIVTKPFQSIRQLVSRVGSLVSGTQPAGEPSSPQYSTVGLESTTAVPEAEGPLPDSARVLIEAPVMETHDDRQGPSCAADIDLQTADTQRLERVTDDAQAEADTNEWRFEDTVEVAPPVISDEQDGASHPRAATSLNDEKMSEQIAPEASPPALLPEDSLLELDEGIASQQTVSDDVFLDLDFEDQVEILKAAVSEPLAARAVTPEGPVDLKASEVSQAETVLDSNDWATVTQREVEAPGDSEVEPAIPSPVPVAATTLSSQAIDEIAEKVVRRLSDKVVREIAWEVVPELAELMIKQKLEEQK